MDIESVRKSCLSLPHVTEDVQWENDLLFRIGNKMFTVLALDASAPYRMSFKCTPEEFGAACAFLCSSHASFVSGQNLQIDGGSYPGVY